MTSRKGYTPRKKRPASVLQEEPLTVINCLCPLCDASFTPHQIAGGYLNRRCPRCNGLLNTKTYDKKATEIAERRAAKRTQAKAANVAIERTTKSLDFWKRWHIRPAYWFMERRKQRLNSEQAATESTIRSLKQRLHALAKSRYYTSEWYLRTMIPIERNVVDPFRISIEYDQNGFWKAQPSNAKEAGLLAEIQVAQVLFDHAADPSSPLYRAQVLPNIYLPRKNVRSNTSFWTQIDCLLLTRQAAYIIETKRHSTHIVMTPSHLQTIFSTRSDEPITQYRSQCGPWRKNQLEALGFEIEESRALSQNAQHVSLFAEVCPQYPREKIYAQVVFVKPRSFDSPHNDFTNNANVSYLVTNDARFIRPIEELSGTLPDLITQAALEELGENLLDLYGDLNQKRGRLHELRLNRREN